MSNLILIFQCDFYMKLLIQAHKTSCHVTIHKVYLAYKLELSPQIRQNNCNQSIDKV